MALFDRAHRPTTLYSSSIVTMPLSSTLTEIQQRFGRKLVPLVFGDPVNFWGEAVRFMQNATTLGAEKLE